MKVILHFEFTEEDRRKLRAHRGRGGKATRHELREWMLDVLCRSKGVWPEPKTRKPKAKAIERRTFEPSRCTCTDETLCGPCATARAEIARRFNHEVRREA